MAVFSLNVGLEKDKHWTSLYNTLPNTVSPSNYFQPQEKLFQYCCAFSNILNIFFFHDLVHFPLEPIQPPVFIIASVEKDMGQLPTVIKSRKGIISFIVSLLVFPGCLMLLLSSGHVLEERVNSSSVSVISVTCDFAGFCYIHTSVIYFDRAGENEQLH